MRLQEAEAIGARLEAPDVIVENHGSIILFRPLTPAAHEWIEEKVEVADWQWFGSALAVEPRYAGLLVQGMMNDGLEVQ